MQCATAYAKLRATRNRDNSLPRYHRDTEDDLDMDSFMASLIRDESLPEPRSRPFSRPSAPASPPPYLKTAAHASRAPAPARSADRHTLTEEPAPAATAHEPAAQKKSHKRMAVAVVLLLVVVSGLSAAAFAFLPQLTTPSNPFDTSLREEMGIPLYYPTKLPTGYKMELGSISRPETDVVLYAVSNETGQRFNVTLQKQPADIDLEPLYASLKDVREISTSFGMIKVGTTTEGLVMANALTGQTWIIISGNSATLNDALLTEVIDGLKA